MIINLIKQIQMCNTKKKASFSVVFIVVIWMIQNMFINRITTGIFFSLGPKIDN